MGSSAFPPVDERLVAPECGYEIVDGLVVAVTPAFEPHARRHAKLAALLEAHVAEGFTVAVDMLTRTAAKSDFAPDVSIYAIARDPETGGRQLEDIAFEIVSSETLAHAGAKAASLVARGVRRVFAIDVERERALEWSTRTAGWEILGPDARIEDRLLVAPLDTRDLVAVTHADDAIAHALIAKGNTVIDAALAMHHEQGRLHATVAAIIAVLAARGLTPTDAERSRILALRDEEVLARAIAVATRCAAVDEIFGR